MKVLMTADPVGGVWRYAMELCAALQPYGVRVMLATLGAELSERQHAEVETLSHVELRESRYRLEWMDSPWESLDEAAAWLYSLEHEFEPDLIHLNHLVHADLLWRAPVLLVAHSCVLSWWNAVHGAPAIGWERYREEVTRSLHAANLVITPTRAMMRCLQEHYGPLVRADVIPNGVNPNRFRAGPKEPFILSAGRVWDAGKNVAALSRVASEVVWPIVVAGAALSPDGRAQEVGGVQYVGALAPDKLADWYARASIYALPARYEPFGLTALEAALSGCALVLGDIDSLHEVWGDAACYVAPDDTAALRDTLNDLAANPEKLATLAALAHARAHRYDAEELAARYWNAYWSLSGDDSFADSKDTPCVSYSSITP
jgi:glycosyltransferase involved in cell wall biosynthesis